MNNDDDTTIGCVFLASFLLAVVWVGFWVWAGISVVRWLVTK